MSPTNAKNLKALAFTLIMATSILGPVVSAVGTVVHPIGSGTEEWWIAYPDQHSMAGSVVNHPSWALDTLKEKPVIILIHRINCPACVRQETDIERVLGQLGDEVAYEDLLTDSGEAEVFSALSVYDPSGHPRFVPVTVVLTLVPGSDGNAEVGWHSAVGYGGERWVRSYLNDAIALHDENSAKWDR